jgi:squalene-hopene/tetraprenyl-beta-curcumene cyclase
MRRAVVCLPLGAALLGLALAPQPLPAQPAEAKTWDQTVSKAVGYLRRTQARDGSWGGAQAPGVTGLVVAGLMQTKAVGADDPMIEKAVKYIVGLRDPSGHLAGKGAATKLHNYVTSINVVALVSVDPVAHKATVDAATKFLRKLQWDEDEGKGPNSDFYGGAGYDSKSRPDLSNTQMFLEALKAGRVPRSDKAWKNAAFFVSRCQNLKGEHNNQPWAGKINDGSFVYTCALGGATKVIDKPGPDGALPGYGSMTWAGVKCLIYCGVPQKDERIQKALGWLREHYDLSTNAGMPKDRAEWGLYYYYLTMARSLDALGSDVFVDAKKARHDWRAELTTALARRQRADGSWLNEDKHWMETNPHLVTGYALLTLAHTRPRR